MDPHELKKEILSLAKDLGYLAAGISGLTLSEIDRKNLLEFLSGDNLDDLEWMRNHSEIRLHPEKIHAGARSALVLASPYFQNEADLLVRQAAKKISRYALGKDYHRTLRRKGKELLKKINSISSEVSGRIVCDSAPVPEKILGRMAGIGWQGKNTNLIHPEYGSYFFLSVLFLNVYLPPDLPVADRCGSCVACIDACPTGALENGKLIPHLCLSYLTIEKKDATLVSHSIQTEGWVFGCDICQEVCPWNKKAKNAIHPVLPDFLPEPEIVNWLRQPTELDESSWEKISVSGPLKRTGRSNFNHWFLWTEP